MNRFYHSIFTIIISFSFYGLAVAKSFPIEVEKIFENITSIQEIEILNYIGDSVMTYVDLKNNDTLYFDCPWKNYSDPDSKADSNVDSADQSWEGTFPKTGETIIMIQYLYAGDRVLFARKLKDEYRFWDPMSIPFSNSVFFMLKGKLCSPSPPCLNSYFADTNFHCSDGFIMSEYEFNKLRNRAYLNFINEDHLKLTMQYFKDSMNMLETLGEEDDHASRRRSMTMVEYTKVTQIEIFTYADLGVKFFYVKNSFQESRYQTEDFKPRNPKDSFSIEIQPESQIPVLGMVNQRNSFRKVIQNHPDGFWKKMNEKDNHYFAYVTPYVTYKSRFFDEDEIDQLHEKYDDLDDITATLLDQKIFSMVVVSDDSFWKLWKD